MSWSDAPTITRPPAALGGWSSNPTDSQFRTGGWFSGTEKVALLTGDGRLLAVVKPIVKSGAEFGGGGDLAALYSQRESRAALFSGISYTTADAYPFVVHACVAAFTGGGSLEASVNDGLSGIVQIGCAAAFSGGGVLHPTIEAGQTFSDGLSAIVRPVVDGLYAEAVKL